MKTISFAIFLSLFASAAHGQRINGKRTIDGPVNYCAVRLGGIPK